MEPAAARYQIDFGGYAEMYINGQHYGGASGKPLQATNHSRRPADDPLDLLRKLRDVTDARHAGHGTVRGTPCRAVAVRAGSAEFTVWLDDEHVRRIQAEVGASASTRVSWSGVRSNCGTSVPRTARLTGRACLVSARRSPGRSLIVSLSGPVRR